jgi:hypothetical protein
MELKTASIRILNQLSALIGSISQDEFTQPLPVLNDSTLGQHIRHTIEFFTCLQYGIVKGVVNYDQREHDKSIESDKLIALNRIDGIEKFVNECDIDQDLMLEMSYGDQDAPNTRVKSNILRELAYNIEHSVHHMAIIKIGALSLNEDLRVPADFGVAASTIRYQQNQSHEISA